MGYVVLGVHGVQHHVCDVPSDVAYVPTHVPAVIVSVLHVATNVLETPVRVPHVP